MKLVKFFPAALAVLALASCQVDELEGTGAKSHETAQTGDLRITWDPFDNETATRALANNKFANRTFEQDDRIYVYDEDMHATDIYAYDADKNGFYFEEQFENDKKQIEGEPSFGVFAGIVNKEPKGYVLRSEKGTPTCVDIKLPHVLEYKEMTVDGAPMYGYDIPAFGEASYSTDASDPYIALDNFRYLTALLRIRLDNAFGNVSFLKITNGAKKPLSGNLTAKLYAGDDRMNSKLEVVDEDYLVYPEIYIDLTNVPSNKSYVYIPIVPGLDGDTDDIKVLYTGNRNISDVESEKDNKGAAIVWSEFPGMKFPNTVFEAHKRYAGKHEFKLEDMNPKKISDMLAQYSASSSDITIDLTTKFTIKAADKTIDNVVYLPKFDKEDMVITINLVAPFTAFENGSNDELVVKNVDDNNPTNAKVILNLGTITPDANKLNLNIDAPGADVQAIGDFSGQTKLTLANAAKVTIGDGTNATNFSSLTSIDWGKKDAGVKDIVIADKAKVTAKASVLLEKTINETVTVNGELDATGVAVSFPGKTKSFVIGATGEVKAKNFGGADSKTLELIEVAGKLTASDKVLMAKNYATALVVKGDGVIEATNGVVANNVSSTITIQDKGKVTGNIDAKAVVKGDLTITSETDKAVEGDVTIGGNVTVNMQKKNAEEVLEATEGEAITGTLTMQGAAKSLNLVSGYIKAIKVATTNAGTWEDKYINIKLDDAKEGWAAFKELAIDENNTVKYTKSVWNGKYITNATYKDAQTTVKYKDVTLTSKAVFTASQLAFQSAKDVVVLFNDIDLTGTTADKGKAAWKGFNLTKRMMSSEIKEGALNNEKTWTISNLDLSYATAKGLINVCSADEYIQNIILDGVTCERASETTDQGYLGALIGVTGTNPTTINNVTVKNINLKMTGKTNKKIGGLVGANGTKLTLKDVKTAGTIEGYSYLGGFLGSAQAPVEITTSTSTVNFDQSNVDSGKSMDVEYARIGGFIGSAINNSTVTIDDKSTAAAPVHKKATKEYISDTSVGTGSFYLYTQKQNYIGYCGANTTAAAVTIGNVKIGANAYKVPKFSTTVGGLNRTTAPIDEPLYDFATEKTISARVR